MSLQVWQNAVVTPPAALRRLNRNASKFLRKRLESPSRRSILSDTIHHTLDPAMLA